MMMLALTAAPLIAALAAMASALNQMALYGYSAARHQVVAEPEAGVSLRVAAKAERQAVALAIAAVALAALGGGMAVRFL